ncbi:hypothetical protein NST48_01545 [Paenibacillus sp. FSL M7-0547]|uniref:hypothetical protein n=1 Tax=Paenibacillus sp. FSL M7-0547 TaxID=2954755 RepID=UPI0030F74915
MTLRDFLKRVTEEDKDKMMIFREDGGWCNIDVRVCEHEITIYCDDSSPFSSDN